MERPDYGGAEWHVFINLFLWAAFLLAAILGAIFFHLLLLLLILPAAYFMLSAFRWKRGSILEERLKIREELIKFVKPRDGDRVLDVGTGGGLLAIGFAKAIEGGEVVGIDIWMKFGGGTSLRTARRNAEIEGVAGKVKFEEGDARNIPYPDNYFDIVVASFAIHVIYKDRERALQEMIRVLKPGGKFAVIEPPRGWAGWKVDEALRQKLEQFGLQNVRFQPLMIAYPKKRQVYIIYGEKRPV